VGRGVKEKNLKNALLCEAVKDGVVPFATVASSINNGDLSRKGLNFRTLFTQAGDVPLGSIRVVSERYANSVYGFFLGKRVAYLVIANYDGLSAIATKTGTPLILDSYTSDMCIQSWGRSSYGRALIEIQADVELKDTILVSMPKLFGERFYTCTIRVEYEWKPPRVWKSVRYGVSKGLDTAYWGFLEHGYTVSSLMDMAYWLSESLIFKISSFKLQNVRLLLIFTNYSIITAILKYKGLSNNSLQ
ncbi:hypothetical protein Tco_1024826, partial [Tanacetum coccineum]